MKKLLVKKEFIVKEYKPEVPAIPAIPDRYVKTLDDGKVVEKLEQPLKDDGSPDESYVLIPGSPEVPSIPEQLEEKEIRIIAQTQGSDEDLAIWLDGDKHKYPEGYWVEYQDITAQVEQEKVNAEALKYLADTDYYVIRNIDNGSPYPEEIRAARQAARERIVK